MMMKNKKAQSALEFLTTYGWAFLVILIMIGALGYFGILNPTRYLPERCSINSEFTCEEFNIDRIDGDNMEVTVVMSNSLGQAIDLDVLANAITLESDVFDADGFANSADVADVDPTVAIASIGDPAASECVVAGGSSVASGDFTVAAGEEFAIRCHISNADDLAVTLPNEGSKLKVVFDMSYVPQGNTLSKPIAGELFATLQ